MNRILSNTELWKAALEKYGAATNLSVQLFGRDAQVLFGPIHTTPLFQLFHKHHYEPGIFAECARRCLDQTEDRPALIVSQYHGLAVVGTSLVLSGEVIGAAVAGYALIDFSQTSEIHLLARRAGIGFDEVWHVVRRLQPVSQTRLNVHGELLQVLGDAILRENYRTRQYEETAAELKTAAEAKDRFLAMVSHELRTPLVPIVMWARILRSTNDPEELRLAIDSIERNASLQGRLIEDLLDLSRVKMKTIALRVAVHDLSVILRSAVESIQAGAEEKQVGVKLTGAHQPMLVEGDSDRLQQIFTNLLSNALKFTPAGGSICMDLAPAPEGGLVATIRDTGQGITPDFLPHVFEMFRQQEDIAGQPYSTGLGIGLALAKHLVELHGGRIDIQSEGPGLGTTATVHLPRSTVAPTARSKRVPAA